MARVWKQGVVLEGDVVVIHDDSDGRIVAWAKGVENARVIIEAVNRGSA